MVETREGKARDEALLALIDEGDEQALETLVGRYRGGLFSVLLRNLPSIEDAEDAFQEVWLRVFRHRREFRRGTKFSTWLFSIAVNLCRDAWRRRRVRYRYQERQPPGPEKLPAAEKMLDVRRAVLSLPETDREALVLRYFEGFSEAEAAAILGCPPGTVKSRLHHAVQALKERLCRTE
jgi:RNA polymerase sigma-70 factor (ECF subfamily)